MKSAAVKKRCVFEGVVNDAVAFLPIYGFNWMWKRFRWGRTEEVSLKNKQLEGGWGGGRSASPPDAFAEHAT